MPPRAHLHLLLVAAVLCLSAGHIAQADPVYGEIFTLRQPDGAALPVRIWGDEFYSVVESLDGYTLVRDPRTQVICYAALSTDGTALESTGLRADAPLPFDRALPKGIRISAQAAAVQALAARARFEQEGRTEIGAADRDGNPRGPSQGDVIGITLLIDFVDDEGTIAPATVTNYCNELGYTGYGNHGSVRDYFSEVSDGRLNYTNYVMPAYYRALHPKSYYTDPEISFGTRARELVREALEHLAATGFDFSQYDADGDGIVDALNCFYAGERNSAWSQGLWPHAWTISFQANGVRTQRYQMTDMRNELRLATFCHENGHMLMGWPDLYDYGGESYGVGKWCIMASSTSATNPQHPSAFMKVQAGWAQVIDLILPATAQPVPHTGNVVYRFRHPLNPLEYFLIENRQKLGRDIGLPGAGLAIWHIDEAGSNDHEQMLPNQHYKVSLEQADGRFDLELKANQGDASDLYRAPVFRRFAVDTTPGSRWWVGDDSGLALSNISASGAVMTFDYDLLLDCNGNGIPDGTEILANPELDCNHNGRPDTCDIALGLSLDCNADGVPDECQDCNGNGIADDCESATAGLAGAYYRSVDLSGVPVGRSDPMIAFNWGSNAPLPGFPRDGFSVRWTGYVRTLPNSGVYTFLTRTDDGVRLWVDGQLLIDKWVDQSTTEWTGGIELAGDREYALRMEYFDSSGSAIAELRWQAPGRPRTLIPSESLRPTRDCNRNDVDDGCDLASGTSLDLNHNGIPDECETPKLCPGDMNCDGVVNFADIARFIEAVKLPGPGGWVFDPDAGQCLYHNGDMNGDGSVDFGDIGGFIAAIKTPNPVPCLSVP
ncbi:MAG: M6 family metalloprotease domain-containing protein [Phycisphaerales bacterium]|nr:M6 family metalloprotease domain-containing protein [Phycisphaerales bacterium]